MTFKGTFFPKARVGFQQRHIGHVVLMKVYRNATMSDIIWY